MMCCERAYTILGEMEHPRPSSMPRAPYHHWIRSLTSAKFKYLVTAQVRLHIEIPGHVFISCFKCLIVFC